MMDAAPDKNPLTGISLMICAVTFFVAMASLIKACGQLPTGQILLFRNAFALFPIICLVVLSGELSSCFYTKRPWAHLFRSLIGVTSMGLAFYALARLPLPEATALSYAQPIIVVFLTATFFGENVRLFRWSAVCVGLVGVAIISWPKLTIFGTNHPLDNDTFTGVLAALLAATLAAFVSILVRNLVRTERISTIVVWLSVTSVLASLLTLPFGWAELSARQYTFLICAGVLGGIGQLLMTQSFRHAEPSTIVPFEYTSLLIAIAVSYFAFGEVPSLNVLIGGTIVISAGIFIIWRERKIGVGHTKIEKPLTEL